MSPIEDATCQAINAVYEDTEKFAILNLGEEHRHISAGDMVCTFKHVRHKGRSEGERVTEIQTDVQSGSSEEDEKIQELWQHLKLNQNTFLMGRPDFQERLWRVLSKFNEVFARKTQIIGKTSLIQFEVELEKNAKPLWVY